VDVTSTHDVIRKVSQAKLCNINRQKEIAKEDQEGDGLMFEDGTG
jgi:hypothetical protein